LAFGKSKAAEQWLHAMTDASALVDASAVENAVKALQWSPEPLSASGKSAYGLQRLHVVAVASALADASVLADASALADA